MPPHAPTPGSSRTYKTCPSSSDSKPPSRIRKHFPTAANRMSYHDRLPANGVRAASFCSGSAPQSPCTASAKLAALTPQTKLVSPLAVRAPRQAFPARPVPLRAPACRSALPARSEKDSRRSSFPGGRACPRAHFPLSPPHEAARLPAFQHRPSGLSAALPAESWQTGG